MSGISHYHENFYIEKREGVTFLTLDSKLNVLMFKVYVIWKFVICNLVTCNSDQNNKNVLSTYLLYENDL